MKNLKQISNLLLATLIGFLLVCACEKEGSSTGIELGGNTDLPQNQVGSSTTRTIKLGKTVPNINSKLKVIDNINGVVTAELSFTIPPEYNNTINNIGNTLYKEDFVKNKSSLIDTNGNLKWKFKVKNSSEGVAIVNTLGKQAVIMKYDVSVGDNWTYKKKNGQTANFKVIKKSTTDDYNFGFFNIKVVKVERTSNEPGISKIVYIGNHKFGLVGIEIHLEDGSIIEIS